MKSKWLHVKTVRNVLANELALLRKYRTLYVHESGFSIPIDYANAVRVRIMMNKENDVVGGFCFNTGQTDFRYFGFDPAKAQAAVVAQGLDPDELSEITGIVFGPQISRAQRQRLYAQIARDLILSPKSVIMGGSFVPGIRWVQKQLMRHTLYTTIVPVTRPDGQVRMMELEVYYAYRREVLPLLGKALIKDVLKHVRFPWQSAPAYTVQQS